MTLQKFSMYFLFDVHWGYIHCNSVNQYGNRLLKPLLILLFCVSMHVRSWHVTWWMWCLPKALCATGSVFDLILILDSDSGLQTGLQKPLCFSLGFNVRTFFSSSTVFIHFIHAKFSKMFQIFRHFVLN